MASRNIKKIKVMPVRVIGKSIDDLPQYTEIVSDDHSTEVTIPGTAGRIATLAAPQFGAFVAMVWSINPELLPNDVLAIIDESIEITGDELGRGMPNAMKVIKSAFEKRGCKKSVIESYFAKQKILNTIAPTEISLNKEKESASFKIYNYTNKDLLLSSFSLYYHPNITTLSANYFHNSCSDAKNRNNLFNYFLKIENEEFQQYGYIKIPKETGKEIRISANKNTLSTYRARNPLILRIYNSSKCTKQEYPIVEVKIKRDFEKTHKNNKRDSHLSIITLFFFLKR